jgi:hypothetical protein
MHKPHLWSVALLSAFVLATFGLSADDTKPKYTIEEIMKKTHQKPNLAKKLMMGQLTDAEKTTLIENYEELGKNKPPKGDAADWAKRTSDLLAAAKAAVNGGPEDRAAFKKAVNCTACHNLHKTSED